MLICVNRFDDPKNKQIINIFQGPNFQGHRDKLLLSFRRIFVENIPNIDQYKNTIRMTSQKQEKCEE